MDHEGVHPPNPETDTPWTQRQTHPGPRGRHPPSRQTPPIQADTPLWADTPLTGKSGGRYSSYWNTFLFLLTVSWLAERTRVTIQSRVQHRQLWDGGAVLARSHGYNPYRAIATRSKVQADVTVCMHVLRYVVMVIQSLSLFFFCFFILNFLRAWVFL